jgi:hypothetical protein
MEFGVAEGRSTTPPERAMLPRIEANPGRDEEECEKASGGGARAPWAGEDTSRKRAYLSEAAGAKVARQKRAASAAADAVLTAAVQAAMKVASGKQRAPSVALIGQQPSVYAGRAVLLASRVTLQQTPELTPRLAASLVRQPSVDTAANGPLFPTVPRPSRSNTPMVDQTRAFPHVPWSNTPMVDQTRAFPHVPSASRAATPAYSETAPANREVYRETVGARAPPGVGPETAPANREVYREPTPPCPTRQCRHSRSPSVSDCVGMPIHSRDGSVFATPQNNAPGSAQCHQPCHHSQNLSMSAGPRNNARAPVPKPCYLCFYSDEPVCVQYSKYIMQECARTSRQQVAQQVSEDICEREMMAGRTAHGASIVDIERHIALHMLHPSIKVPELIRELDGVRHILRASVTNICPDTGTSVIDSGNVSLYLRVVRELQQVYKMGDPSKLSMGGVGQTVATLTADL